MTFMDDFHGLLSWTTFKDDFHGWLSWMTVMDDCHVWLSWMTFMDDFHGWLLWMTDWTLLFISYFYILFKDWRTDWQTDGHWYPLSCYRDWKHCIKQMISNQKGLCWYNLWLYCLNMNQVKMTWKKQKDLVMSIYFTVQYQIYIWSRYHLLFQSISNEIEFTHVAIW